MLLHLPTVHMAPDIYQLSDANISHSDYSTSRVLRPIGRLQMKHALGYLVRPTIQVMTGLLKREGSLQMIGYERFLNTVARRQESSCGPSDIDE